MKLPTIYLIVSSFFILTSLNAQSYYFESVVYDNLTESPLENATVSIEGTDLLKKTDQNGRFLFTSLIPKGEYVVSISKDGYEPNFFIINAIDGKKILIDKISLKITKKELKRRKRAEKDRLKKLKKAKKAKKAKDRILERSKKEEKINVPNKVNLTYTDNVKPIEQPKIIEPPKSYYSAAQLKYAKILEVPVEKLINQRLYDFIDNWIGVPYLIGGETSRGIDCSSFTQRLFIEAYDVYIERTAQKQFNSKYNDAFRDKGSLREGDLIFFTGIKDRSISNITHVGVYLHNNKFVHSTTNKSDGNSGVKISDLRNPTWSKRYLSGGRRKDLRENNQQP